MQQPPLIERVLLVAGRRNTGKSTQLRAMFRDPRLGNAGEVLTKRNPLKRYRLSPDRRLYLRLRSPHESDKTLEEFMDEIAAKTIAGRWCVASAVQIEAAGRMPGLPTVVAAIHERFSPERIRIVLLSPDQRGDPLADANRHLADLRGAAEVAEVMCVDARTREGNGLLLADTFDFA